MKPKKWSWKEVKKNEMISMGLLNKDGTVRCSWSGDSSKLIGMKIGFDFNEPYIKWLEERLEETAGRLKYFQKKHAEAVKELGYE